MARWITLPTASINASGPVTGYLSVGSIPQNDVPVGAGAFSVFALSDPTSGTVTDTGPASYWTQGATGPYFVDSAGNLPASTTRLDWEARLLVPSTLSGDSTNNMFRLGSTTSGFNVNLNLSGTTSWAVNILNAHVDGTARSLTPTTGSVPYTINSRDAMTKIRVDYNTATMTVDLYVNDSLVYAANVSGSAGNITGGFPMCFNAQSGGGSLVAQSLQFEYLRVSRNGTLYKEIVADGDLATINTDAWKLGGNAT